MIKVDEIKRLRAEADRLEAELKAETWPCYGDPVFLINHEQSEVRVDTFRNDDWQNQLMKFNKLFRAREEAQAELDCDLVVAELKACDGARKFVKGERNWMLTLSLRNGASVQEDYDANWATGWKSIYFATEIQRSAAIAKVGEDRILKAMRWSELGEV